MRDPEQPKLEINLVPTLLGTKSACNNNSSAVGFDALTSIEHRKFFPAQTQTHPRSPVVCNPVTTLRTTRPCNMPIEALALAASILTLELEQEKESSESLITTPPCVRPIASRNPGCKGDS